MAHTTCHTAILENKSNKGGSLGEGNLNLKTCFYLPEGGHKTTKCKKGGNATADEKCAGFLSFLREYSCGNHSVAHPDTRQK